MKPTTVVLLTLLASAIAQPHRQHNARHHHHKRAESIIWVTDWVTDYTTVDTTTTIWVSEGYIAPTTPSSTPSSSAEIPAQFFGLGSQAASPSTSSTPTPTPVYVAPAPVSTYVPPTISVAPVEAAPTPSSTSEAQVYVAPVYTPAAETTPTATPVAPAAPVSSDASGPPSSGSSGGACNSGSPCEGDITYYEAGLGACGVTNDGSTENVVALPHALMGPLSNSNPYCGKTITIKCTTTGKTTTATVVDKCMGCQGYSIDLSNAAFLELDDLAVGRTTAEWWFN